MFDKLIGNAPVKEIMRRMLGSQRVPHSLIFAGAEGVGKKRFALELAKTFVCRNPQNFEACDSCAACNRAGKFTFPAADKKDDFERVVFSEHPDVGTVIPYKNSILIEAIRELETEANFRPYEAGARFFIIDDAEKLSSAKDNAANALLKTLEEPPPTSYIFLVTSRPDALLPTILSRCQTLRFAPVPAKEIETHLLSTKKFSPDDAELLAQLSAGSIGRALRTDSNKLREGRDAMLKILDSILVRQDRSVLLRAAEDMNDAKNKDSYDASLETLETLIHDVWTLRLGNKGRIVNADIEKQLTNLAERADAKRLAAWLVQIETMRENFNVNLNRKIATDALFMQMAN
ncbi:MAG TPA: DNA polymerase III subunit delta' [Pyrinomonadaceae bacterium]|nr:DNA polymerase III subunit delta' [Pyrinomonadaceae bacterium]